jgi:hypothetical protein
VQLALRQLAEAGKIRALISAGRGRVSRYQVLYNQEVQDEAPQRPANGHDEAPQKVQEPHLSVSTKGANDAPIAEPVKGAKDELKGAKSARKGATIAPKPLRTTSKKNHQGGRARAREAPGRRNIADIFEEATGLPSFLGNDEFWDNRRAQQRAGLLQ